MTSKDVKFLSLPALCLGLLLGLSAVASATHDEPGRGRALRGALVTSYENCTSPNTTTAGGLPQPACSPPVRSDPVCGFGSSFGQFGSGKATGVARDGDIELAVTAKGLGNGCEGWRLCGVVQVRVTTHRCTSGIPCTTPVIELTNVSDTACCLVANGSCKLRTSVNNEIFDALRQGERAGVEVVGCGLRRRNGPNPPTGFTFSCGLLAP